MMENRQMLLRIDTGILRFFRSGLGGSLGL
jgi:hypothetical protein